VFVCENNLYMEYTPISAVTPVENPAADRASAYGLERILIDGNNADEVYRTARSAIARARAGAGPSLIEALTYRHHGHSRADPAKYRPKEEVDAWMKRDPIPFYRQRLIDFGVAESAIYAIEDEIKQAVDHATEVAKASQPPGDELIYKDVWADGGWAWRN
jgi:acetoin:2,6-dichlorophenolindophenol oxidoreductase subunit alpha